MLLVIGVVRIAIPRLTPPPPVTPLLAPERDPVRAERLARACDAVRDHMDRGASFGPLAREGFVAELWLAVKDGADLRHHPAVTGLVAGDKLSPTADDKLADVIGGEVAIGDGLDPDAAARWKGWSTVTITFSDGFGRAFFEEEERPRFVGLADRVARATGATHGALYARCAHQTARAVGAWFRGPDLAGATATLVYEMGVLSDAKVISSGSLTALRGPGGELANLSRAAEKVEDMVTGVVGTAGGSVTAGPPPSLLFSLAAPARAVAAAKEIARPMGIAPQD